jgi:ferredoxin-type protein NapH
MAAAGLRRWLRRERFLVARRAVQVGTLLVFFGTLHWGWAVFGRPLLAGNLSSSTLLGAVPLADPLAVLQILATGHVPLAEVMIGAGIVLAVYGFVGGRSFCAWVCPVNLVADAADSLRRRLPVRDSLRLPRHLRYVVLGLALALSAWLGVAAFEWVSPIGLFHRELLYGVGFGAAALLGLFVFDSLVLRHGWCGHLCPLGAFWAQVGRVARIRVRFDAASCTECGDCLMVCPEPQVLNLKDAAAAGMVRSGECTHCARCIAACPEGALAFGLRRRGGPSLSLPSDRSGAPANGRSPS